MGHMYLAYTKKCRNKRRSTKEGTQGGESHHDHNKSNLPSACPKMLQVNQPHPNTDPGRLRVIAQLSTILSGSMATRTGGLFFLSPLYSCWFSGNELVKGCVFIWPACLLERIDLPKGNRDEFLQ